MLSVWLSLFSLLNAAHAQLNTYYCVEDRDAIVHLFSWKWNDVASECSWLAQAGYCGVQVSPPQEHAIITSPDWRPWWERYQPVSYKLESRSGSHDDFVNMVETCNDQGVCDLQGIYDNLNSLSTRWFPEGTRPYVYQEVGQVQSEPIQPEDYVSLARVTEFRFARDLSNQILNDQISRLFDFGEEWGFLNRQDALAFIDNHDNQRGDISDDIIITHKNPEMYKMAVGYMLAWGYGHPRVMSSYQFDDPEEGPPSDGDGNVEDVICESEGGSWVCEHRWRAIANMVRFHNIAIGEPVENWWDNGNHAVAFSRGDKAFFVMNNELYVLIQSLNTGLPPGEYCNVIQCDGNRPPWSGDSGCGVITVESDGVASIIVSAMSNSILAIHV